jgi:hypothetical protein
LIVFKIKSAQSGSAAAQTPTKRSWLAEAATAPQTVPIPKAAASNGHGVNVAAAATTATIASALPAASTSTTEIVAPDPDDRCVHARGDALPRTR